MIKLSEILVAADLDGASQSTVDHACSIAVALSAHLHVVHVVEDLAVRPSSSAAGLSMDPGTLQTERESDARRRLEAMVAHAGTIPAGVTTAVLTARRPATAILAYARDAQVDLIVAGTQTRHDVADLFMGSVAQEIVRRAPCPVLTRRHVAAVGLGEAPTGTS